MGGEDLGGDEGGEIMIRPYGIKITTKIFFLEKKEGKKRKRKREPRLLHIKPGVTMRDTGGEGTQLSAGFVQQVQTL